jgi:hypothetical protein
MKVAEETSSNSQLTCYITMQDGSKVFTSQKNTHNISKINQMTGPLEVNVHYGKKESNISLLEIDDGAKIKIKAATLQIKESPTVTTETAFIKMNEPNGLSSLYQASYISQDNPVPELTLRITYDNGEGVEKQL